MKNRERIVKMTDLVTEALAPTELEVIDDSHLHVGHAGAAGGAGHFTIKVTSDKFEGLSLVARHRLIYKVLDEMFPNDIHALSIQANTPKEKE